ncbi:MAG TPA: hypothetical protein VLW85_19885 [Myxococcales bacterium]|nr:hypothetical protein [Myxococcales bacterium]
MALLRATALVVAIAAAATSSALLRRSALRRAPAPVDVLLDVPAIPGVIARPLAFGFNSLLSDFTFIESIQALAMRKADLPDDQSAGLDRRLYRLLDYSIEVDPRFVGAYRFAGAALPHETADGKKILGVFAAVEILERGVRQRPDTWHIPFLLGFLQAYYLEDYASAGKNLALAAHDAGAPRYLGLLATRMAAQGGDLETALQLAQTMMAQANEEDTRKQWMARVEDLLMERDLRRIEEAAARYREQRGGPPQSVAALVSAGLLPAAPQEPHGGRYLIGPDGTARSTASERLRVFGGSARVEVK